MSKMKWWPVSESNQGHSDFQSLALPTELTGHFKRVKLYSVCTESKLIQLREKAKIARFIILF